MHSDTLEMEPPSDAVIGIAFDHVAVAGLLAVAVWASNAGIPDAIVAAVVVDEVHASIPGDFDGRQARRGGRARSSGQRGLLEGVLLCGRVGRGRDA